MVMGGEKERGGSLAATPSSPKTLHYVEENRAQCIMGDRLEERGWPEG